VSDAAPCGTCSELAYTARHFPYLVDDAVAQTRVWRCSICGTWWRETPWGVLVTDPVELDRHVPGWREAAHQVVTARLDDLVPALSEGRLGAEQGALALLLHDVVVEAGSPPEGESLVLFLDEATAAQSGSPGATQKSAVDAVRAARGSTIVLRRGSQEYRFDDAGSDYLRLVARATVDPETKEGVA
jgi:hypothetical protein